VRIWGTQPDAIDEAEDRDRWMALLTRLNIRQPAGGSARSDAEAFDKAKQLGYPVMVRPSYVLGGRAMEIVYRWAGPRRARAGRAGCWPGRAAGAR
jgi:carbamoyl-phosphate synthase large subunit